MEKYFIFSILVLLSLSSEAQNFNRYELPTSVSGPFEIICGPDNYLWITESGGRVSRIDPSNGNKTVIYTASDYFSGSAMETSTLCGNLIGTGTLGLALHPDFTDPLFSYIYFVYSYNSGTVQAPDTKFRIKRLKWNAISNMVVNDSNIVNLISTGYDHLGGRLMAIKQNNLPYLFLSVGDHGISEQNAPNCYAPQSSNPNNYTQDVSAQNGKIHRYNMDGTIPTDNPISGNPFYTRGHRNPQGLMYNPNLELIYDIEHGDRTDDEINILYKGMNYGWKNVRGYHFDNSFPAEDSFVINYVPNAQIINDSLVQPLYAWCNTPNSSSNWLDWCTVAPSGGIYYGSNGIPEWNNSLLVVTLKDGLTTNQELYQFKLQANGALVPSTTQDPNPKKYFGADQSLNGRLRDIAVSTDGQTIYLVNNGGTTDKITVYHYAPTSVNKYNSQQFNIQLFPNPATDILSIKGLENSTELKQVLISGIVGDYGILKFDQDYNLNVSELSNGIYFIHLQFTNETYSFKFIKM